MLSLGSTVVYALPFALLGLGVFFIQETGGLWKASYLRADEDRWGRRLRTRWFIAAVTLAGIVYGGRAALGSETTERLLQALLIGLGYSMNELVSNTVSGAIAIGEASSSNDSEWHLEDQGSGTGQPQEVVIKRVYLTYVLLETKAGAKHQYCVPWKEFFKRIRRTKYTPESPPVVNIKMKNNVEDTV